jgi:predicted ABC-type ATPase
MNSIPRLRMFVGPNGSGKSTLNAVISSDLLGVYVNPDEIENQIIQQGDCLDLSTYGVDTTAAEVLGFFRHSRLLEKMDLLDDAAELRFTDNKLSFFGVAINAYFASVAADFIRQHLLETGISFSFETVMSSSDKMSFLQTARQGEFRTYLYYIATEDPIINISRVRHRVKMGGHSVPEDKIVSHYQRSLDLLFDAVRYSHRAYIFDNSGSTPLWLAEITDGKELNMKVDAAPYWFKSALWDKFDALSS